MLPLLMTDIERTDTLYPRFRGRHLWKSAVIDKKKLTTLLIPGEFSHAAMCVSLDAEWEVSEMTHSDYTKSCFFDIFSPTTNILLKKCCL